MFSIIFFLSYYFLQRLFSPSTKINTPNIFYLFFRSLAIFSRSKYSPLRVFILQICFFPNTSLPQVYSLPTSLPFYSSLSEYLPCNNFFHNVYQPQPYYPLRYSLSVTVSPHPIDFNDFLRQCFISLVTSFPLPENIYLPWIYFYHFSSVVSYRDNPLHIYLLSNRIFTFRVFLLWNFFPKTIFTKNILILIILSPSLFPLLRLPTLISL